MSFLLRHTLFFTLALATSLPTLAFAQNTTINWDFTDLDGIYDGGNPVNFTINSLTAVNSSLSFNTTSSSTGYPGASGGGNASVSAISGPLNLDNSTYFTFTLTPDSGYAINSLSFSFGSRTTTSGPILLSFRSSADGFATDLDSAAAPNDSTWHLYTFNFDSTGPANAPVEFRLYGSGGTSTSSNWRIDDLNFTVGAVAIPEPSVYALLGVGLLVCGQRFLRRRSV